MYGRVSGVGAAAGVPAALAFTGVTGAWFALSLSLAALMIMSGVFLLRRSYRHR